MRPRAPEVTLYGDSGAPEEAVRLELKCCDDPTPVVGVRNSDGSTDLYCQACDRSFARLYPQVESGPVAVAQTPTQTEPKLARGSCR